MSSTNKTTNYELSQFIGTDKPAWLTDYNGDMGKIDTAVKNAADAATIADGKADTNTTAIGTLANLTTDEKTNLVLAINEVDGHADTAQSTANTASNTANTAKTTADTALLNVQNFNLTSFNNYTVTGPNVVSGYNTLTVAKNADGSLCKIYGEVRSTYQGSTEATFTTGDTGLRPSTDITVNGTVLRRTDGSSSTTIYMHSLTIKTDGKIEFKCGSAASVSRLNFYFMASLIFVKDFGDVPLPE